MEIWKVKKLQTGQILYNKNKLYSQVKHNQTAKKSNSKTGEIHSVQKFLCQWHHHIIGSLSLNSLIGMIWVARLFLAHVMITRKHQQVGLVISLVLQYILRALPSNHDINFCRKMYSTTLLSSRWKKNVQGHFDK